MDSTSTSVTFAKSAVKPYPNLNGDLCFENRVVLVDPIGPLDLDRNIIAVDVYAPIEAREERPEHTLDGLVGVVSDYHSEGESPVEDLSPLFLRSLLVSISCFGAVSEKGLRLEQHRADVTLLTLFEGLLRRVRLGLEARRLELVEEVFLAFLVEH